MTDATPLRDRGRLPAGARAYSLLTLPLYDGWVHGFSNPRLWGCSTARLGEPYGRLARGDHLDVGVGTGLLPDRYLQAERITALTLFDVNAACLDTASRRLARFGPRTVAGDLFRPLAAGGPFTSVSFTYVLHCLAGSMADKAIVLDHLAEAMVDDGILFGATLFQHGVTLSRSARMLQGIYNARGIFSNRRDHPDELRHHLAMRFRRVRLDVVGAVGLFEAAEPIRVGS